MKHIIMFLLAIMLAAPVFSQKKKNQVVVGDASVLYYDMGKEAYGKEKYAEAINYFIESLKVDSKNEDALYFLGMSYKYTNQPAKALEQFQILEKLNPNYSPRFYYELGEAYGGAGQFDKASEMQELFLKNYPSSADKTLERHQAKYKMRYANEQESLRKQKTFTKEPVRLSDKINSKYDEYAPVIDPTGTKLYFTSRRLGGISREDAYQERGDEDIYFIEKVSGAWSEPKLMPSPINSESNEGIDFITSDGQLIGFSSSREDAIGSTDIYFSVLDGTAWSDQMNMGNVVNSDYWDSNSTISPEGNRIIFSSIRPYSNGLEDLYMIEKNLVGEWSAAINLGGVVNTPFTETAPFLSQDGKTLYFSSDGHPGYGNLDIFKTVYENGKWSVPVNLGTPLNTAGRDDYFTIGGSGEVGYFSRYGLDGKNSDLYEIEIPESLRPQPTVVVEGIVTNSKTGERVAAHVMVEDLNSGEIIAVVKSNSVSGRYLVVLPSGKSYSVSANKETFFFHSERFDVAVDTKFETIKKDIPLKPIEKGTKIVLNNIFFETGKATLTSQSKVELEKAIDLLNQNPSMVIEVGGHTDNVGDDDFNMKLSHDRAKSVRDYLVTGGIVSTRVQAKGYGETNPVATNDTDDGRKANRRTEFVILEF